MLEHILHHGRKTMKNRYRIRRVAIVIFIALVLIAAEPPIRAVRAADRDLAERIDEVMISHYPKDEPGVAVLAARDGEVVFRGAYGLASLELHVPVRPESVFCLASVTKLFTAVAAMMLVEEGVLRLEDEVTDYLPNLKSAAGATIAHLLSHTSGMTGPITSTPGYREENIHREISSEDLIASYADFALEFLPGERFQYSNEGVATLARIIEIVSNQSWEAFLQERIFEPADMKSTSYGGHNRVIPGAVTGYTNDGERWRRARASSYTRGFGMGGLFSDVDDLLAWRNALLAGRLVKPATLDAMFTPFELNDGGYSRHGLGFIVTELQGHKIVGHGGSHNGWSTFVAMMPNDGIFVTVLTNRTARDRRARDDALAIIGLLLDRSAENG
jgi:CubicO group peptidase (beta-lactamase class C family)